MSEFEHSTEEDWQRGREEVQAIEEDLHGPVVGEFHITGVAENGDHPLEIRAAWKGIKLPVRERFAEESEELVKVLCTDGYNALVEANVDEKVRQYWIDLLDGRADANTTFDFRPEDGDYFIVTPKPEAAEKTE